MITQRDIEKHLNNHPKTVRTIVIAFIVKNGKIISVGYNYQKSVKNKRDGYEWSIHAEYMAIRKAKEKAAGANMYVVRILRRGGFANSEPCETCDRHINKAGIKRVWYT